MVALQRPQILPFSLPSKALHRESRQFFLNHKLMTHGGSDDIPFCGKWDYSQILTEERNLSPARETSE